MSRKCEISNTQPLFGNKRSHAMNANSKKWNVNLQTARIVVNGKPMKIKISARALRTLKRKGQINN